MKKFYSFILFAVLAMAGLQSQAAVYVLGNTPFGNWGSPGNAIEMTQGEDGIYSLKMEGVGANCYFSIMLDNVSWDSQRGPAVKNSAPTGEWEDANVAKSTWKTSMAGDYTILYNAETEQAKITIDNGEEPDRDGYFLIGAFNDWSEDTQVPFVKDGDKYTLTQTFSGEFKIRDKSGDWFGGGHTFTAEEPSATLGNGENFKVEGEAEYTLTIENGVLTISGFGDVTEDVLESLQIRGSVAEDWSGMVEYDFEYDEAIYDAWVTQIRVSPGFQFKVVKKMSSSGDHWLGAESDGFFWVTEDQIKNAIDLFEGAEYQNLYFVKGGNFTFVVDKELTSLTILGEFDPDLEPTFSYKIVMGEGGDWENAKKEIDFDENLTINNYDIVAGTEFKVVKVESYDQDDTPDYWHWLGAESAGNFWVTDEQLGNAIPLYEGAEYQNLYFEDGGKYSFTFDAVDETLTIVKAETDGDVNGDGTVNSGDISELYKALLDGSNDPKFDLNNDGSINTGDVSDLYMIILGN